MLIKNSRPSKQLPRNWKKKLEPENPSDDHTWCEDAHWWQNIFILILPPIKEFGREFTPDQNLLLCFRNHCSECLRFADCQVRQHLAVEFDVRLSQGGHELAVGGSIQTGRSIDTGDP
jgi:hypothetical protein